MTAFIYRHEPIELSMVILQPVITTSMSSSTHLDVSDLDLSNFRDCGSNASSNGLSNGYRYPHPARIIRQGETIGVPRTNGSSTSVRVITSDPVQQGILTSETRVIVTSEPHVIDSKSEWNDMDGTMSESSHGRTHLSLTDFDPDAFLSSSLDLRFSHPNDQSNGSPLLDSTEIDPSSQSSTSGSITPRPNGTALSIPSSPPAQIEQLLADEIDHDAGGAKFSVIVSAGPSTSMSSREDENVCWMGVGGLGRAGIFEGDWVSTLADFDVRISSLS